MGHTRGTLHDCGQHGALARLLVTTAADPVWENISGCGGAGAPAGAAAGPPSGRRRQQGGAGGPAVGRCDRRCAAGSPPPSFPPWCGPFRVIGVGGRSGTLQWSVILQGRLRHRLFVPTSSNSSYSRLRHPQQLGASPARGLPAPLCEYHSPPWLGRALEREML